MEQLSQIIVILCKTVIAMGILYNLGCFPATEKVVKFIIAVYIIYATLNTVDKQIPVSKPYISNIEYSQYQYSEELNDIIVQETQNNIENIIKQRLTEKNISYNWVYVHILEQNNLLTADSINICCSNSDIAAAEDCIKDFITKDTQIYIGE